MNAKLIASNRHGAELRRATRRANTWPGYHDTMPLGRAGYWFGTAQRHEYLGCDLPSPNVLADYEFDVLAQGKE